jgi:hypothetical protein
MLKDKREGTELGFKTFAGRVGADTLRGLIDVLAK